MRASEAMVITIEAKTKKALQEEQCQRSLAARREESAHEWFTEHAPKILERIATVASNGGKELDYTVCADEFVRIYLGPMLRKWLADLGYKHYWAKGGGVRDCVIISWSENN